MDPVGPGRSSKKLGMGRFWDENYVGLENRDKKSVGFGTGFFDRHVGNVGFPDKKSGIRESGTRNQGIRTSLVRIPFFQLRLASGVVGPKKPGPVRRQEIQRVGPARLRVVAILERDTPKESLKNKKESKKRKL